MLELELWPRGATAAICRDPDKPMMGKNRVVAYGRAGLADIQRPVWCRRERGEKDSSLRSE